MIAETLAAFRSTALLLLGSSAGNVPAPIRRHCCAADALARAADAIATALQGRITARERIPAPSAPRRGQQLVALPAIVAAKLELYRAMIETKTRKADLARKLRVHAPQVDRLLDLDHKSQLDQIEAAARAIGREFHIELRPAA